jgi:hypothetical protein
MAAKVRTRSRGQLFAPTAGEWNAVAQAANTVNSKVMGGAAAEALPLGMVRVRNDSGQYLARFNVVGIDDALVQPHVDFGQFVERPALKVVEPDDEHVADRFAILLDPLAPGAVGRAITHGETPALVKMLDETHRSAIAETGMTANLVSAPSGVATLLSVQPIDKRDTPDMAWCIVRLGGGGGGAAILAVCVSIAIDPMSLSTTCVCKRMTGLPEAYESGEELIAWAGTRAMIRPGWKVLLMPIEPIADDPDVKYVAIPLIPALVRPLSAEECNVEIAQPCEGL